MSTETVPARRLRSSQAWWLSLALLLPATVPYLVHYLRPPPGCLPTGFIHYDMLVYAANARAHFHDGLHLFYSNPFDATPQSPHIYFQLWGLSLGLLWRLTQWAPGTVLVALGFGAAWLCVRVAVALYEEVVGLAAWPQWLGLVAFIWGGGVLALAGAVHSQLTLGTFAGTLAFDPSHGWWFLNLGRNLIFPTEALYHALFLGAILCAVRRRFGATLALAGVLSLCHPIAGVELLVVLCLWSGLETFFLGSGHVPKWFLWSAGGLLAAHVAYYVGFLNLFAEHRQVSAQFQQNWTFEAKNYVPALLLVGALALWRMRRLPLAREVFSVPRERLFLTWFLGSFLLAHHEILFKPPMQPVHFDRGYVWTALFLLGAPSLIALFKYLRQAEGRVAVVAVLLIFVSDNAFWFTNYAAGAPVPVRRDRFITREQDEVLKWLSRPENQGSLVLCDDSANANLTPVYTPLRTWSSHQFNTPEYEERRVQVSDFFSQGKLPKEWHGRTLLAWKTKGGPEDCLGVMPDRPPPHVPQMVKAYENADYVVYRLPAADNPARPD